LHMNYYSFSGSIFPNDEYNISLYEKEKNCLHEKT
jgi:hypothetical protein